MARLQRFTVALVLVVVTLLAAVSPTLAVGVISQGPQPKDAAATQLLDTYDPATGIIVSGPRPTP